MAKELFMKKLLSSMGLICILLFAFTVISCESIPWDMVADSLTTVGNSLQNNSGGGSSSLNSSSTQYNYDLTIVNNTGYTVWYVYVKPSSSSNWTEVLGSDILGTGYSFYVYLSTGGRWDVRLEDSDRDTYTKYGVNADSRVVFTFSDIDR
jgi:hypothetical protein